MTNILENYTNEQRREFMKDALLENKRIEKYDNTLFALAENEIVQDGEIVVDDERVERLKREEFERQFFNTSLGWIKRKVYIQKTGETKDFLTDIKPNLIPNVAKIITYQPNEDYSDVVQTKGVLVTDEFLNECSLQLNKDFYG